MHRFPRTQAASFNTPFALPLDAVRLAAGDQRELSLFLRSFTPETQTASGPSKGPAGRSCNNRGRVAPAEGEAVGGDLLAGVLLLGEVHVHREGALAADVVDALFEGVVLAFAEAGRHLQLRLGAFRQGAARRGIGHGVLFLRSGMRE